MNEQNYTNNENQTKPKKRIKVGYIIAAIVVVILIAIVLINPLMKFHSKKVELGSQISSDIKDYVNLYETGLYNGATLDVTEVNTMAVGKYEARLKVGFLTFKYKIDVIDTTAPEIMLKEKAYAAIDRPLDPKTIIADATDLSGTVDVTIEGNTEYTPTELGEETITVKATDPSGNSTTAEVTYTVEYPPVIVGAFDNIVKASSGYNPLDYIAAADMNEGNINDKLVGELGGFDINKPGEYDASFSVTNNHGLTTSRTCKYTVSASADGTETKYLNSGDIRTLIDYNYFKYTPLSEPDRDSAAKMVAPTLVCIYGDELKVSGYTGAYSGSGVIYSIESEYIYISTNEHVAKGISKWVDVMDIIIYDGTKIRVNYIPDYKVIDGVDIAMFRIPISDIPQNLLLKLRQIYVEEEIDETMKSGDDIFFYAPNWKGNVKRLDNAKIIDFSELSQNDLNQLSKWRYSRENQFLSTATASNGMSGTGIYDFYGRFVGNCSSGTSGLERGAFDVNIDNEFQEQLYRKLRAS